MHDYDGFVKNWNLFGVMPPGHQEFLDFIEERAGKHDILELGSGNGLISAGLGLTHRVLAVDVKSPIAEGAYTFMQIDGASDEFFDAVNSGDNLAIVGRRSFCLFYFKKDWMKKLNESKANMLLIQSLEGDKGYDVNSSDIEGIFLRRQGWKTEVVGRYVCATR
jgi:hypothetical protein